MATRATIAENLSLPVFSSTQPHAHGAAAAVQFDVPKLKCFQRPVMKRGVRDHTGQAGPPESDMLPQAHADASPAMHLHPSGGEERNQEVGYPSSVQTQPFPAQQNPRCRSSLAAMPIVSLCGVAYI